ncbi:unnamed protein product [Lymnaea stagnalis]|uniref:Uncharacterized protein n=1 Tax=Lymnaea stagnalis TaxID=6523 RepID=A0AAV2H6V8_LYMST
MALLVALLLNFLVPGCVLSDFSEYGETTHYTSFGPYNQYQCRCVDLKCGFQGDCWDGYSCQKGWFGPGCQYDDLVSKAAVVEIQPRQPHDIIADNNQDTCLHNTESVILTWGMFFPFTWLRIQGKDLDRQSKLSITFLTSRYTQVGCVNQRTSAPNNSSLDVYCDVEEPFIRMTLTGKSIKSLCSLYVSGGRNIAFRQNTTTVSWAPDGTTYTYRTMNGDQTTYSHSLRRALPSWQVSFETPASIDRYVFHNRPATEPSDEEAKRFVGFVLTSYSVNRTIVFTQENYKDQFSYSILSPRLREPVAAVRIRVAQLINAPHTNIRGVAIYGDSVCPTGKYGRDCELSCNCATKEEPCFVSTGGCTSGCAPGYHGEGCRLRCSPNHWGVDCQDVCGINCIANQCDDITGRCYYECMDNYKGPRCDRECEVGVWGPNCTAPCDDRCVNQSCNATTGQCDIGCIGLKPPSCKNGCDVGWWGLNCLRSCDHCSGGSCDKVTGQCDKGCAIGRMGQDCQQWCSTGFYGNNCTKTCPEYCFNSTCDPVSGRCYACREGYFGKKCDEECGARMWGPGCSFQCSEKCVNKSCDRVSGECDLGCETGFKLPTCFYPCDPGTWGDNCTRRCEGNCLDGECDTVTGLCNAGCSAGYQPPACTEVCDPGTYGYDCAAPCPSSCAGHFCDAVTGKCAQCDAGYRGQHCEEDCEPDRWGPNCAMVCSSHCHNGECDVKTGQCLRCRVGFTQPLCHEQCHDGSYGQDCTQNCSRFCAEVNITQRQTCHHVTGTCLVGCKDGHDGVMCYNSTEPETVAVMKSSGRSSVNNGLLAGLICVVLIAAVTIGLLVYLWWRHVRKTGSFTTEDSVTAVENRSSRYELMAAEH